jgi:hypothetical protein
MNPNTLKTYCAKGTYGFWHDLLDAYCKCASSCCNKKEHKFPTIAMLAKTIFWQFNKPKWNQMDFFSIFGLLTTFHCYHHNDHFRLDICQQKLMKWPTLDAWNPLILQVFVRLRQLWCKNWMLNLRWSQTWKFSTFVWTIFYGNVLYDSHGIFFSFL